MLTPDIALKDRSHTSNEINTIDWWRNFLFRYCSRAVNLTATAEADAYAAFERIRAVAPSRAARWLTDLFAAIRTLADLPARCPVIPEADELDRLLRQLMEHQIAHLIPLPFHPYVQYSFPLVDALDRQRA